MPLKCLLLWEYDGFAEFEETSPFPFLLLNYYHILSFSLLEHTLSHDYTHTQAYNHKVYFDVMSFQDSNQSINLVIEIVEKGKIYMKCMAELYLFRIRRFFFLGGGKNKK